jgi:hypothetical protein
MPLVVGYILPLGVPVRVGGGYRHSGYFSPLGYLPNFGVKAKVSDKGYVVLLVHVGLCVKCRKALNLRGKVKNKRQSVFPTV